MAGSKWINSFIFAALLLVCQHGSCQAQTENMSAFVKTNTTHFVMNDKPMYLNGYNAYWMMYMASDPSTRAQVTSAFKQASLNGMNVARTWAFNDGGNDRPLQISPGHYSETTFQGLDFVISEAKRHGIFVILSLVNNFNDYGGRSQYVKWANDSGEVTLTSEDDFYINSIVKEYYKDNVEVVLTRINSITGVAYKDDPTIFAWELINEPRANDFSCTIIQKLRNQRSESDIMTPSIDLNWAAMEDWVKEMAAHVKSIDNQHMLEIGLEGFFSDSRKQRNPDDTIVGTDFISNNLIPEIDFATIHLYPEIWLFNSTEEEQSAFVDRWIQDHIQGCHSLLRKPLIIAEFGKRLPQNSLQTRDKYFGKIYDAIYTSAVNGGPFVGGLFWQLLVRGMDSFGDGYQVVLEESPSTASIISEQSGKLLSLIHGKHNQSSERTR